MSAPVSNQRIEALPWDSEFFGVSIGKVDLNAATETELTAIETEAHDRQIDCIYGQLDPNQGTVHTALAVQRFGHHLVDVNMLMARPAIPYVGIPTVSSSRIATEADMAILEESIAKLAPWSRFGADPRFGEVAARRMHTAWVERAIRDDNRMLAIAEDDEGITGLATHVDVGPGGTPCVDLMGVVKPGTGVSGALIQALVDWAPEGAIEAGPCAARNIAVLRFLERYDFSVSQVTYTYHWWREGSGSHG